MIIFIDLNASQAKRSQERTHFQKSYSLQRSRSCRHQITAQIIQAPQVSWNLSWTCQKCNFLILPRTKKLLPFSSHGLLNKSLKPLILAWTHKTNFKTPIMKRSRNIWKYLQAGNRFTKFKNSNRKIYLKKKLSRLSILEKVSHYPAQKIQWSFKLMKEMKVLNKPKQD